MFDSQKKKNEKFDDKEKTIFAVRNSFKDLFSANVQSNIPLDSIMNTNLTSDISMNDTAKTTETVPETTKPEVENTISNDVIHLPEATIVETNSIPVEENITSTTPENSVQIAEESITNIAENVQTIEEYVPEKENKKSFLNDDLLKEHFEISQAISESTQPLSKRDSLPEKTADYFKKPSEKSANNLDNNVLLISEKDNKVYLPYTMDDIHNYLQNFSSKYSTAQNVIENEFVLPLNYFNNFHFAARFREAYALYKDREGKTALQAINYAFKIMKIGNLHPAIIAACKNEKILADYIEHLENNDLQNFTYFKVSFKINPSTR